MYGGLVDAVTLAGMGESNLEGLSALERTIL